MDLKKVFTLSIFLALFGAGGAHAAMVTVNVTGTIDQINANDIFGAGVGDTFMMSYSYDTDTAVDGVGNTGIGLYLLGTPMSFTLGGVTYTAPSDISANLVTNDDFFGNDGYSAFANGFSDNGFDNLLGIITFYGGSVFADDSLPLSFALTEFENADFLFGGSNAGVFGGVSGTLDSISFSSDMGMSPVPLPAAIWLFGSALAGLFGFKLRRRKTVAALPA